MDEDRQVMELPHNFTERFSRMEQRIEDVWKAHTEDGCPSQQKLALKVDGIFFAGVVVTTTVCGWIGWLTVKLI